MEAVEKGLDVALARTRQALERQERLFSDGEGAVVYDAARIAEAMARFRQASPGPWTAVPEEKAFDNWFVVFSGGADYDGRCWAVTTDHIHASEMVSGGAREDCEFVAHAWADMRYLLRLVQQQRLRLWEMEAESESHA